jgi:hypothetical protein
MVKAVVKKDESDRGILETGGKFTRCYHGLDEKQRNLTWEGDTGNAGVMGYRENREKLSFFQ